MALVDRHRPLHVSIVGGEPLVRYRELEQILPQLAERRIHAQLVTSAVRPIPREWAAIPKLQIVTSIDGLQPEHDARRTPATYDRILKHIEGHQVTVHCTITRQQVRRDGYIEEFLRTWQENPNTRLIWISLYTPQNGEISPGAPHESGSREGHRRPAQADAAVLEAADCSTACSRSSRSRRSHRRTASSRRRQTAILPTWSAASCRASLEVTRTARTAGVWHRRGSKRSVAIGWAAASASDASFTRRFAWDARSKGFERPGVPPQGFSGLRRRRLQIALRVSSVPSPLFSVP